MSKLCRHRSVITGLFLCLAMAGCSGDNLGEVQQFIEQVKARPKTPIEPLPEIKPHEIFAYSAAELRDPFTPPVEETVASSGGSGVRPDTNRTKEPLEAYPLDVLKMVGTLERGAEKYALIKDPDGLLHRVQPGNYMGQNDGKIVSASDEGLDVMEIIEDGQGGWIERAATVPLNEESTEGKQP